MSCARYRQLLSRYVDGEVTPRQRQELMAHLQGCRECALWLAKARQTDTLLKGLPEAAPSDHVRSAILSSVQHRPAEPPPHASKSISQRPALRGGGLRLGAAGLLLRFDPSTRSMALAAAASLLALVSLAYWTGVLPPITGYNTLGFEFPNDNSRTVVNATPLAAVSLGSNGVGGPVAAPNPVRILPTQDAAGVPADSPLRVRFDQPMDRASVENALLIQPPVAGTFRWTADNEVSFEPAQPGLLRGVAYSATLSNTARSLAGTPLRKPVQWAFRTREPHSVIPVLPVQVSVPVTAGFGLTFDAPMDKAAAADKIGLYAAGSSTSLPATLTWTDDGRTLMLSPLTPLPTGTVSLRIAESALTGSGETLGKAYEFNYQVGLPSAFLQLKPGRVKLMRAGEAYTVKYGDVANDAVASPGRLVVSAYRLGAERLSALKAQALPWPYQLPEGFTDGLVRVRTFRAASPEEAIAGEPVTVEGLPAGIYLLRAEAQARGTVLTDWQLLIVADRNLAPAPSIAPSTLWATDESGSAWAGAEISLYAQDGALLAKGATTQSGLWSAGAEAAGATLAVAQDTGGHLAATLLEPIAKLANTSADTLAASLQTDRAIYLPGQTVNFRALMQISAEAAPATPSIEQDVTVQLRTPEDAPLATLTLRPDSVGGVGGLFPISSQARPGTYIILVRAANAQRRFPIQVAAPDKPGLSVYIAPSVVYTADASLLITRTVSVLGEAGVPAAGAAVTATLGITGDGWASQPLTALADQDGRATFTVSLPQWAALYKDPGLSLNVQASLLDKAGAGIQYVDLAPANAEQNGLPQIVAPLMDVAAKARSRPDGSIAIRIVELGSTGALTVGNVLLTVQAPSGERFTQVVDLAGAGGDVTVRLGEQFAGGAVGIMRGGQSAWRKMVLMPAASSDVALRVTGPEAVAAGSPMPLAFWLRNSEGQGMSGVASVWLRPVSGGAAPAQPLDWNASIALQAGAPTTTTLTAPTEPGLWYIMAEAATPDGVYQRAWSVVRVTPGLSVQLPPPGQPQVGQPQAVSVVLYNPTDRLISAGMRMTSSSIAPAESQDAEVEAGAWSRLDWQYSVLRPGQTELKFDVTAPGGVSATWGMPVQPVQGKLDNTFYAAGLLTGERSIAVHVPSGLRPDEVQLEIRAATSLLPALADIAEGLPVSADDPEQGVELTAARLSSASVVGAAYRRVQGEGKAGLEQSGVARSLVLQDLYSAQNADGGWGAQIGSQSSIADTGSVLLAIRRVALATSDGTGPDTQAVGVDAKSVNRGLRYLTVETSRLGDKPLPATLGERAYGMYVLSLYGLLKPEQARPLMQYISSDEANSLTASGRAWLALSLWQAGDTGDALVILDGIAPTVAKEDNGSLAPLLELSMSASAAVRKATPSSAGTGIRGKQDAAGYEKLARNYAQALMESRQGLGWDSPAATADAVWSLSLYAAQQGLSFKPGAPPVVTINDRPVQAAPPSAAGATDDTVSVLLSGDALQAGANWLKLKAPTTESTLYYSLTLKANK